MGLRLNRVLEIPFQRRETVATEFTMYIFSSLLVTIWKEKTFILRYVPLVGSSDVCTWTFRPSYSYYGLLNETPFIW